GIGVGMFAVRLAMRLYDQRTLPSEARMPIRPRPTSCTYCFTPPPLETTIEEYPAPSLPDSPSISGAAARHCSSPVCLLSLTTIAPLPPGVHSTLSPSTSGASENPQPDIMRPFHSWRNDFCQRTSPSVDRQTMEPLEVTTYRRFPSTVGVHREPG